jgi:hypothetical protein
MRGKWIVVAALALLLVGAENAGIRAASAYASPLMETNWQQAEKVQPNFWGPLSTAHNGQMEPYAEAPGGKRLVQYFDKARMEQFDPNAHVTTGLLTVELKSGKVQLGNNTFEQHPPAQVVMAGDPGADGPTYADLAQLMEFYPDAPTTPNAWVYVPGHTFRVLTTDEGRQYAGQFDVPAGRDTFIYQADPSKRYGQYAYTPFVDFINRLTAAGIPSDQTPGYAISPVLIAQVPIGSKPVTVFMQAFERRVLTYNPNNSVDFRVEFGNIGQHYYRWRYGGG